MLSLSLTYPESAAQGSCECALVSTEMNEDLKLATAEDASQGGESVQAPADPQRKMRLFRIAGVQWLVLLVSLCLFAAADSWTAVTGLAFASVLGVVTGILAGVVMTSVVHETFHLLGAQVSGGAYKVPANLGIFMYDWQFEKNSVQQFFVMSWAGSVGGALTVILLWASVPPDTAGRASLHGAAVGAFVYAAIIEWPVLQRTRHTREPFAELSKINERVLLHALYGGVAAGVLTGYLVHTG